jgi:DNA-directed RNA polymerase subunit L
MELNIIDEKNNKLILEIKGEGHTLANVLRKELWEDKHIKAAGYNVKHPLEGVPRLVIETDGKEDPKKALVAAVERIKKKNDELKKALKKDIK